MEKRNSVIFTILDPRRLGKRPRYRQVFGLMGIKEVFRLRSYRPSLPSSVEPVLYDGFRSHLPLRGSSGFSPDSLFRISAAIQPRLIQPVTGDCVARRDGNCQVTSELQIDVSFDALLSLFSPMPNPVTASAGSIVLPV